MSASLAWILFQSPKNSHNPLLPSSCGPKDISRIAIIARSSTWWGNETEDAHLAVSESSRINNELIPRTLLIVIPNLVATTAGIGAWKAPSPAFPDPDNNSFHRTRVSCSLVRAVLLTTGSQRRAVLTLSIRGIAVGQCPAFLHAFCGIWIAITAPFGGINPTVGSTRRCFRTTRE